MIKRWVIAVVILLFASALILPQLATDAHYYFQQEFHNMTIHPTEGWQMVLHNNRVQRFYLIFVAVTALLLIWGVACSNYLKYRSNMQQITPDIAIPCAAGQGQFGTARWMKSEHIGRYFTRWKIPKRRKWFKKLMAAGKASYKEVKDSDLSID